MAASSSTFHSSRPSLEFQTAQRAEPSWLSSRCSARAKRGRVLDRGEAVGEDEQAAEKELGFM